MTSAVLSVFGALGGVAVFAGAVWGLLRGLVRQADAVKANTSATTRLTETMERVAGRVADHAVRIRVLEERDGK